MIQLRHPLNVDLRYASCNNEASIVIRITLCISRGITLVRLHELQNIDHSGKTPQSIIEERIGITTLESMKQDDEEMLLVKTEKLEFYGIIVLRK